MQGSESHERKGDDHLRILQVKPKKVLTLEEIHEQRLYESIEFSRLLNELLQHVYIRRHE